MYTLYKFHFFLNGISEINQLFDDILIIWPAPVYVFQTNLQKDRNRQSKGERDDMVIFLFDLKID